MTSTPGSPRVPAAADSGIAQPTVELLDRARAGDGEAVNRLLDRHRSALRRMIDRINAMPDDANA